MTKKQMVLVISSATIFATGMGVSQAQESVTLSMVHGSPESHVITKQGVEPWMACVSEETDDQVSFDYYPGGQISKTPELLRAIHSGIADIAPVPIGYVSDELPLNGVSMLPGLGSSAMEIVTGYSSALKEGILKEEFTSSNLMPLMVMAYPPYQIVSMGEKIDSAADFEGKVLRSAGGAMNLAVSELGASPAEIPIGDTYIALERGTADGTISAFASIKPFSLHELMKSMSSNGAFGTFTNVLSMSLDDLNAMSSDLQETLISCGSRTEEAMASYLDAEVEELSQEFTELGIDVYEFSPDELDKINDKLAKVQEDWVQRLDSRGLAAAQGLEEYNSALNGQ
ncbi:TRAP transporter substrate-binding protein DctP [Billgrantia pellis]|uniref:TRAP transporter substrate-binding protein DctP n=1 Tax=Billgrantia pellis TaxID=2606936 RepID=A0A7V7FWM3_9GAMM|nr:TRAP transporter substrate-binding protein DctP [Halomonas pellis]KAA0010038.1 TRAP transporter substrate-binding protein DctP [Halomonas pellis]